jgi:inner membrane protein
MFKYRTVNLLIRGNVWKNAIRPSMLTLFSFSGIGWGGALATGFSHAAAALSLGSWFYYRGIPKQFWVAGALCSMVPDVDVVGFHFGIPYGDFWGHRGFTHSLLFAVLLATFVVIFWLRRLLDGASLFRIWSYLFLATASHGLLDAMTDGGLGVAFFSPFNNDRYFLPWRPIRVSPLGFGRFFTERGFAVLQSELLWIWFPAGLFAVMVRLWRECHAEASAQRSGGA